MRLSLRDTKTKTASGALPSLPHVLTHPLGTYTKYNGLPSVSAVNFLTTPFSDKTPGHSSKPNGGHKHNIASRGEGATQIPLIAGAGIGH